MAAGSIETLQRYLRRLCDEAVPPDDAVLLDRFVTAHDREAFEAVGWPDGASPPSGWRSWS